MANDKNDGKLSFKERWGQLPPGTRRMAVTGMVVVGVVLIAWIAIGGSGKGPDFQAQNVQSQIKNALGPGGDARDIGLGGMSRSLNQVQANQRQKDQQIAQLTAQLNAMRSDGGSGGDSGVNSRMQQQLADMSKQIQELKAQKSNPSTLPEPSAQPHAATGTGARGAAPPPPPQPPATIRVINASAQADASTGGTGSAVPSTVIKTPVEPSGTQVPTMYIPSGSILTGVNITGLDAPTGKQAMANPIPMLIRIKHDAILPNRYKADVKECFVLASGYGDLASERAYLRSNTISCVRSDRRVIDIPIDMFAVGPDGKAGIRGRLISRQGQLIAKAAMAGLAQGVAQAFGGGQNQTSLVTPGTLPSASTFGAEAFGGGVGSAFNSIAKYYLKLADDMFPVVEIDPGQRISFIVTKGTRMGTLQ